MKDITGNRYGKWLVIGPGRHSASGRIQWLCRCDCGTQKYVLWEHLRRGNSKSCGCLQRFSFKDITGCRFGKLVAIKPVEKRTNDGSVHWLCICDCGNTTTVNGSSLRKGVQISCGCTRLEHLNLTDRTTINHKKHGACPVDGKRERLYGVWDNIKQRCNNPNNTNYKYYGGRGIKMCELWENDYASFREWAMANGYDENAKQGECTIDRINNDGNYTPDNCRFVSMKIQARNKRKRGIALNKEGNR